MDERKKAMEALPEVVAAKKVVDDAKNAKDAFGTVNAQYGQLIAAEKNAQAAYKKTKNDAEAADAERSALQQQMRDLQKQIDSSKK
jgi:ABC-type phosphate transport system auxiliary subunit